MTSISRSPVLLAFILVACGASTATPTKTVVVDGYPMTAAEADQAARFEREKGMWLAAGGKEPEVCAYWSHRANTVGRQNQSGLGRWVITQENLSCKKAEAEAKASKAHDAAAARDARSASAAQQRREVENKRELARRGAEDEVRSGTCAANRAAGLEQLLQNVKTVFDGMATGAEPELFRLASSQILLVKDAMDPIVLDASTPAEVHMLAASYVPIELDVLSADGTRKALRDPYEAIVRGIGAETDSRMFQVNAGDRLKVAMRGQGCSLLMVFRKY